MRAKFFTRLYIYACTIQLLAVLEIKCTNLLSIYIFTRKLRLLACLTDRAYPTEMLAMNEDLNLVDHLVKLSGY